MTAVVCSRNGKKVLPATLDHLAAQEVEDSFVWEAVFVDSASTDGTTQVARDHWKHASVPLCVVRESKPGHMRARLRGVRESSCDLVTFVDDDNWLTSDWLTRVSRTMADQPRAAACGGPAELVPGLSPPPWFERYGRNFAVGQRHQGPGPLTESTEALWGAGLTIRRAALTALLEQGWHPRSVLRGRRSEGASSWLVRQNPSRDGGGDTELCLALRMAGWEIWYEPSLRLVHNIDPQRIEWTHLRELKRGMGWNSVMLDAYRLVEQAAQGRPTHRSRRWLVESGRCVYTLLRTGARVALRPGERDSGVLDLEWWLGRFLGFLHQRRVYDSTVRELEAAPWLRRPVSADLS